MRVLTKPILRKLVSEEVAALPDRTARSTQIWNRFREVYQSNLIKFNSRNSVIGAYLNFKNEIETARFLFGETCLDIFARNVGSHAIAVPFCVQRNDSFFLEFYRIDDFASELAPQKYGILEPTPEVRAAVDRLVKPNQFAFVLVPGVAFDRMGNRLGRGAGYYDNFLKQLPRSVPRIAFAFDCQLIEAVPTEPHDESVDYVITENEIIRCDR